MIKVSTNNFYVGNKQPAKDARLMASFNCDVSGVQEGHSGNAQAIKESLRETHKVFWRKSKNADKQLAFLDTPVVYPKGLNVLRTWARQISVRSQVENIGMARAATAIRFKKNGKTYTLINVHPNAAVQNRTTQQPLSTSIKRVAEYVAGMVILEAMVVAAKRRGDRVIITGDLNYRTVKSGVWKFSPQALFNRHNMSFVNEGLEYIAYSKALRLKHKRIVPRNQTGSDHPWVIVTLDER